MRVSWLLLLYVPEKSITMLSFFKRVIKLLIQNTSKVLHIDLRHSFMLSLGDSSNMTLKALILLYVYQRILILWLLWRPNPGKTPGKPDMCHRHLQTHSCYFKHSVQSKLKIRLFEYLSKNCLFESFETKCSKQYLLYCIRHKVLWRFSQTLLLCILILW